MISDTLIKQQGFEVLEEVEPQKADSNELEQINHCAEQLNNEMDDASTYQIAL